jgi:hypothetical protein
MFTLLRQFSRRNERREDSPVSLWNDIFLFGVGFFNLGVCLFGIVIDLGPRFVAGAHIDWTPVVSYALIGSLGLFLMVEGYLRIDRTINLVNERLKHTSVLN